jgi:hypothetical protein
MKRVLIMLTLAFGLVVAACGGSGTSPDTSVEPFSPATSMEASPDTMSPEASPS